jgi:c-di-GMP-binding flagellar brake protein YcgR
MTPWPVDGQYLEEPMNPAQNFVWKPPLVADRRTGVRMTVRGRAFDVRLVGLVSRQSFIVTHPRNEERLAFVKDGDSVEITTFDGTLIVAFKSEVMKVSLGEHPTVELYLPPHEERKRQVVRKAHRCQVAVPSMLRYGKLDDQVVSGILCDLSIDGARIAIARPLPKEITKAVLSVQLSLMDRTETIQALSAVRSSTQDPRPGMPATLVGLQFIKVRDGDIMKIGYFVADRLLREQEDPFGAVKI